MSWNLTKNCYLFFRLHVRGTGKMAAPGKHNRMYSWDHWQDPVMSLLTG